MRPGADRKDRSGRDVVGEICRTVEGIDRDAKPGFGIQYLRQIGFLGDDGGDGGVAKRVAGVPAALPPRQRAPAGSSSLPRRRIPQEQRAAADPLSRRDRART